MSETCIKCNQQIDLRLGYYNLPEGSFCDRCYIPPDKAKQNDSTTREDD